MDEQLPPDIAGLARVLAARREGEIDPEAGRQALLARLQTPSPRIKHDDHLRSRRLRLGAVMAAVAVLVATGVFVLRDHERTQAPVASIDGREYRTQRAQRSSFELPDGSRVTLGPESTLRLSTRFGQGDRTIVLEGQAYFSVQHDPDMPFTVRTSTSVTQVLGTVFTIRAYRTDSVVQVAVAEGRVAVGEAHPGTVLLPGDVARVAPQHPPLVAHDVKISDVFGWMHGRLLLDGQSLASVIPDLERAYNLKIELANPGIGQRDVRATLSDESVTDALDLLAEILNVTYTRRGRTVVFAERR